MSKFGEIDFDKLKREGFNMLLVLRDGQMYLGGKLENLVAYKDILKEKEVTRQFADEDVWVVEMKWN